MMERSRRGRGRGQGRGRWVPVDPVLDQESEDTKVLVTNVQAKRKGVPSSSSDHGESSAPPLKVGRGAGKKDSCETPQGASSQGGLARGSQMGGSSGGRGAAGTASHGRQSVVHCGYCGKAGHTVKTCWKKTRKCFKCGSSEHRIAECPIRKEEDGASGAGKRPKGSARVSALDQQKPDPSAEVEGTTPVFTDYPEFSLVCLTLELHTPLKIHHLCLATIFHAIHFHMV
ncbi:MAG: unnamed protein product [uncultured Caballeronia sp.]|nr:MAG: unnamed protein product [uncultured Caballeronia sp.]